MKLPSTLLALAPVLVAVLAASAAPPDAVATVAAAAPLDDPEPLDCPMCGGNANVHREILFALEKRLGALVLHVAPW